MVARWDRLGRLHYQHDGIGNSQPRWATGSLCPEQTDELRFEQRGLSLYELPSSRGEWGEYLWKKLLEAGNEFEIRPFGVEAQRLLRLEKRHVIVGVDTDALTNPLDADMGWVAKMDKPDFIGKAGLARLRVREPQQKLVGFMMQGNTVPEDGAAILVHGKLAGRVTSVRYSPVNDKAVGLAWVVAEVEKTHNEIQVRVNGRLEAARITMQAFYDPEGARLRM